MLCGKKEKNVTKKNSLLSSKKINFNYELNNVFI
jgi:hypothetical protein